MARKKTNHSHQLNCKMTISEYERVQDVNLNLFDGKLNNSDLARFLLNYAMEKLGQAKVEKRTVLMVDGMPVGEVK